MHNLYANFVRIFGVCKQFSKKLVNDKIYTWDKNGKKLRTRYSK